MSSKKRSLETDGDATALVKKVKHKDEMMECVDQVTSYVQSRIRAKHIKPSFLFPIIASVCAAHGATADVDRQAYQDVVSKEVYERVVDILEAYH